VKTPAIMTIVLCILLLSCSPQSGDYRQSSAIAFIPTRDNPTCTIVRVVDGDTLEIGCKTSRGNARLLGFDTPETYRPGCPAEKQLGERAKNHLTSVLKNATVLDPEVKGKDKYDRTLLGLKIDGVDLAGIMVSAGYAVYYSGGKRIDWCARLNT